MKTLFSLTVLASLVLGQFTSSFASLPAQATADTPTPTEAVTETSTAEPTASSTPTATPAVESTASPIQTETPAPVTETATLSSTATGTPISSVTATPSNPEGATPVLSLTTNPDFITPGGNLILNWVIGGVALAGHQLLLLITLPEGLSVQDGQEGEYDPTSHMLTIPVTTQSGQVHLAVIDPMRDVNITAALLENTEVLAETNLFIPLREQFTLDQAGGAIEARGGKLRVEFPDSALPEKAVIEIGTPTGDAVPAYSLLGRPFEIKAYKEQNGEELKHFSKKLSLIVSYADLDIPAGVEGDLYVYWYNTDTKEWETLPTTVDKETKTLYALTDHFTVFDIDVNNWQSSHLPTVDSFQVSSFTGAGTYSLPINVPAGPGGFQPSVALTYNSQVVDQSTLNTQASWVGMGWSLDTGSIEIDTHGTGDGYDDTYLLNVAGISTRIVKDANGVYHTTDENFWKITPNANDTWTVQDKQGNTYYFEHQSKYTYQTGSCQAENADIAEDVYRWSLSRVKNIFNQEIQYTYTTQTKQVLFNRWVSSISSCQVITNVYPVTATYLSTITYANGRYRVRFYKGSAPNRLDYTNAWEADGSAFQLYEKYRLQSIYIEQDTDANPDGVFETIIRHYDFTYKADTDSDIIFPGYQWTAGGKTTTLKSVREYGVPGAPGLPAVTFTYADNLHLTRADNGYGGVVEFTYEGSTNYQSSNYQPWYYQPHAAKFRTDVDDFGAAVGEGSVCDRWGQGTAPWTAVPNTNSTVQCTTYSNNYNVMEVHGTAYRGYVPTLTRPGGMYKLSAAYGLEAGVTVRLGISSGYAWQFSANNPTEAIFKLPAGANSVAPLLEATGSAGHASFSNFKFELLTSVYRVTQKKISDGNGHTYAYDYAYTGPAVNDVSISSGGVCEFTVTNYEVVDTEGCYEFYKKFSEFRGHAQVTETGPDGTKTITQFNQDDLLKGRPSSVTTNNGVIDLAKAIYSYIAPPLSIGLYRECNMCSAYLGLGRNWVYTNTVQNRIYLNDGVNYHSTLTLHTYEATYGNLITQTEQSWNGSGWQTYRSQAYDYFPNNSATRYLVALPARNRSLDPTGNVLASTVFLYDNNVGSYQTMPVDGKLTAVRTRTNPDGSQFSQVSYAYDTWGNRVSETTNSAYSAYDASPPPASARTITTVYDPTYHIYPLTVTNALLQTTTFTYDYTKGVQLTETDPNGAVTRAEYDQFGRVQNLYRPDPVTGSAETTASLTIAYQDFFPVTTTLTQKIDSTKSYTVQRVYDGLGRQTRIISGGTIVDTIYVSATQTKQSLPYFSGETVQYTTTTVTPGANMMMVSAPDGTSSNTSNNGLVTTFTDARGNSTTTTNDIWGRVVSVTPPTGPAVAYTYDALNHLIEAKRGNSVTPPVGANPGTSGLAGWWSMNEPGGMRNDSSYGANHLTDVNTVGAAAQQGNAASFVTANQERLTRNDNPNLSTGDIDFTLVANVYLNNTTSSFVIVDKSGNASVFDYRLTHNPGTGFRFRVDSGSAYVDSGAVAPNTWYTVVTWHDSVNNTLNIQVNNGTVNTISYAGGAADTTHPLAIGAFPDGTIGLDGRIDEVALYKRLLTAAERAWLYNNGSGRAYANLSDPASPGTTNLVSWWSMNEPGGMRNDSSYGANHLTDVNTVGAVVKQGNAASFVTANLEYLSAADTPGISTGNIDFTLVATLYLNNTTNGFVIVDKSDINGTLFDYRLTHNSGTGFRFRVNPVGGAMVYVDSGAVSATTWHTVMAWHDSVNNTINIQVDNGPVNSLAYSIGTTDTNYPLTIGAFSNGTSGLDGRVDEVALYKRVLTASERAWLYNNGNGRSYADLTPPTLSATITTLTYDHAGRKKTMTDPDMGYWTYDYDALGNLTSQTDAGGCTTNLSYDSLSRPVQKSYSNCPTTPTVNYYYDGQSFTFNGTTYNTYTNALGRRTGMMVNGSNANVWNYDKRGRLLSETVNAGTAYTTNWTYNAADMPITMKYPDTEIVNYNYNARMLLDSVIGTSTYVSSTAYDSAGRMDLRSFGNTTQTNYDYFPWTAQGGRLQYLKSGTTGNPTSLQSLEYGYDAGGNVDWIQDWKAGGTPQLQYFGYDTLDRLTSAVATGGIDGLYNETYTYDATTGNLDIKAGVDLNYTDSAHKHAVTHIGSTQKYWYDASGNQTKRILGADTYDLAYDAENRLIQVKKNTVVMATFVYDGDGRRVQSTINGTTTTFIGGHYEVTGSTVTKYYYAGAQRIAMRTGSTLSYLLSDHLGSTSLTTNSSGALVSELRYKPWGETRYSNGTMPTKYQYTGQYSNMGDFGLMFYNARWYDPALGRFTSPDTIIPDQNNVQSWDRFAYVGNNPCRYNDPDGHCWPVCTLIAGGLIGAAVGGGFI